MGDDKLKHYSCSNGAEFVISSDAEKVAVELNPKERNYLLESAKQSNDKVLFTITLPEGQPPVPTTALFLQFKPRTEVDRIFNRHKRKPHWVTPIIITASQQ